MSSPTAADVDLTVVAEDAVPEKKPARRFPPPCWTQEETLALIEAYRERWYALRRGYLRTADWDAVAASVYSRYPDASPAKTSAQCRHKMEKLRQRYRAEKQRSLSCPTGRYFSSWFFFDNMDAMENGTTVAAIRANNQQLADKQGVSGDGYVLKTLVDQNYLKLKLNQKNGAKSVEDSNPNLGFDRGGGGVTVVGKSTGKNNFASRVPVGYSSYLEMGTNKEEEPNDFEYGSEYRMKTRVDGISMPSGYKAKRTGRVIGDVNGFDQMGNKFGNFVNVDCDEGSEYNGSNGSDGFHVRVSSDRNMGIPGSRRGYGGNMNIDTNLDSMYTPGLSKLGKKGDAGGVKRRRDPVEEMVSSIKFLGEGFMKMEKMKMEMAKEVEQMRMEMEMKRNEMILESQKQIVDAFMKVLSEIHKNKNGKTVAPES